MSINILNMERVMGKIVGICLVKLLVWLLFIWLEVCVIFIVFILFILEFKNLFFISYIFLLRYCEIND